MSSLPVKPEYGPTLPALLAPRWRRAPRGLRVVAVALAAVVAVAAVVGVVAARRGAAEVSVVVERPVAFNLRHGEAMPRVAPRDDELLRLEGRRGALFLQSFAVEPLVLRPYRGTTAGEYPLAAERIKARLAQRFPGYALVEEGRTRINEVPGYEIVFTARSATGRRLYGRWVMLVPLTDPPTPQRRGVTLELLGTPAAGIPNAGLAGDVGQLKLPLRSFRFGTEAP